MKSKLFVIIGWELKEKLKRKSFWFSTLFIPLFIFVISSIPFLTSFKTSERPVIIAFADSTQNFYPYLIKETNRYKRESGEKIILMNISKNPESLEALLSQREIDIGVSIAKNGSGFRIFYANQKFKTKVETFKNILLKAYLKKKTLETGISLMPNLTERFLDIQITTRFRLKNFAGAFAVILIFISSILFSGGMFVRGIAEEKSNRIIELLLTSCDAKTILLGKTLGLLSVNVLQLLIWLAIGALFFGEQVSVIFSLPYFGQLIILFIAGYLLFTLLFLSVGIFVKSDSDAQQFLAVISVVVILPLIVVVHLFNNPYDLLTQFLLYFPITSIPTAMLKLSASTLTNFELATSLLVNFIFFLFLLWITTKYFRQRVIEYGESS